MLNGIEITPTEKEINYIRENYGNKKAKEMALELGIPVHRVYKLSQAIVGKKLSVIIHLTDVQEQVILSGILGDGNIKRNGSNYYYRESHSKKQIEYCHFKYEILKEHTSKSGFRQVDNRDGQWGFQTINAVNLKDYKELSKCEVIDRLNQFGLLLYILDDGWLSKYTYNLSTGMLNEDEVVHLMNKFDKEFNIHCKLIGYKRSDISFAGYTEILVRSFKKYIPNDIDIFRNKVQPMINKFKV